MKTRLLTKSSDSRTLVITALHGLGSVGKSTLAAALAHDKEVQAHFSDGILWATLGQQPDVLPLLSGWVQALGDYNFKPTSIEAATNHLRTLLYDKAILLVVDDAWNTVDAQPFNVGGSRCQVLVTTREAAIAKVLGASIYYLDVMKPFQAMELLTKKLGRDITGTECQEAETLAKEIGYLPLALELAAAQVASSTSWAVLLQDIQLEIARLKTFDDPQARDITDEASLKRLSLRASLNLSVQPLKEEERFCFTLLGVLPEDATITNKMTVTLWELDDERDAKETLEYFRNKALLLPGVPLVDGTSTYRLHDLFHDLARNLLTASTAPKRPGDLPGLGLTLVDTHSQLLERYRQKIKNGQWHTLPDDGYIHQHLVWHLFKADRVDEIHELLQEETESGRNGWYEACDRLGQTANFVTDVVWAWELAEKEFQENPSQSIALQCCYALMITSLNSLTQNIPASLKAALVKKNLWTPAQGLAYAQQTKEHSQRAKSLSALAPHLPKSLLPVVLKAAYSIKDDSSRAEFLSGAVPYIPEALLPQALEIVRDIKDDSSRAEVLSGIVPHFPEVLQEALEVARAIQDDSRRTKALSRLAPHFPEVLQEALEVARAIQDDSSRAEVLSGIVPHLPKALLPQALKVTHSIKDGSSRAEVLSEIVPHFPEILPEALKATLDVKEDDSSRTKVLSRLAPHLPKALLSQTLEIVRDIKDDSSRTKVLSRLAPHLPKALLPQTLEIVRDIKDDLCPFRWGLMIKIGSSGKDLETNYLYQQYNEAEPSRGEVLSRLAPQLPEALLPQTLEIVRDIKDYSSRVYALSRLVPHFPEVLQEALEVARAIPDYPSRVHALSRLVPHFPEVLQEALEVARAIPDGSERALVLSTLSLHLPEVLQEALEAVSDTTEGGGFCYEDNSFQILTLSKLVPYLPEALLPRALEVTCDIQGDLSELVPRLPEALLPQALKIARDIQDESFCAKTLSELVPYFPEVLQEALEAARSIKDDSSRAHALSELAPYFPEVLQEALEAARSIKDNYYRAESLGKLVPHFPEVLQEALEAARGIKKNYYRAESLGKLVPHSPEVLQEALEAARAIQHDLFFYGILLSRLAPHSPEVLQEAFETACIPDEYSSNFHSTMLDELAPYLPQGLLPQALEVARSIKDNRYRAEALSGLTSHFPEVLQEALEAVREIKDNHYRAEALSKLASHFPEVLQEALEAFLEALNDDAFAIPYDYFCAQALSKLASHFPKVLLPQALEVARSIKDNRYRAEALSGLTSHFPEILQEALEAARAIPDSSSRSFVFSSLLSVINLTYIKFNFWCEVLHNLSACYRYQLLKSFPKLSDAIVALGGIEALPATVSAIQQVCKQWR